jgi:hypothetical protein
VISSPSLRLGHLARADVPPVAQHRDPVGQREDLRHAVADVDHAHAAASQQADDREQPLHVGLGQRRRRLVHDQHAGVLRERLRDLDALAVADRERAHGAVDVEVVDVEGGQDLARPGPRRAPVDAAEPAAGRVAGEDVLGDSEFGEEQQLLVDRGDAGRLRRLWARQPHRPAVEFDGPASGSWTPDMILMSVDLPAPFSPRSACTSPARTSNDTPSSARTPGNDFAMSVSRRTGSMLAWGGRDRRSRRLASLAGWC